MSETPNLRWFEETARKCSCGKWATGILRGDRNESYGPHCKRCADRRLATSAKEREWLAQINTLIGEIKGTDTDTKGAADER